jgi:hypothetical protein
VEVISGCSNPRVNRPFDRLLRLDLGFLDHPRTEFFDDRQKLLHSVSRRRHYIESDDVSEMIQSYRAGSTLKEIGAKFRITGSRVSSLLKDRGVRIRNQSLEPEAIALAIELYESGLSLAKVGAKLSCDANTVRLAPISAGEPRRDTHGRSRI